jgi:hypothetical protein
MSKRITGAALVKDIIHFFTHLEKGFLHTSWNLLARPGLVSFNYLEGKRSRYQKPVSYFLIWTGLYILTHNLIINHYQYKLPDDVPMLPGMTEKANILLRTHFTIFIIPLLLMTAFFIHIILSRPKYYFIEVLTICLFGAGTYFMMLLVSDIVLGFLFWINTLSANIFLWQTVLSSLFNFWFTYDFFKRLHIRFFWLRIITLTFLITLIGWAIMVYLPATWIYFFG